MTLSINGRDTSAQVAARLESLEFIDSTHGLCALALVILRTSPAANFCVSAFSLSSLRTSQAANYRVSAFSLSSLVVNTFSSVLILMLRVLFSRGKN